MTFDTSKTNSAVNQIKSTLNLDKDTQLISAIQVYNVALEILEEEREKSTESMILDLLVARDSLAKILSEKTLVSTQELMQIIQLDHRLREQTEVIVKIGKLNEWQTSYNPSKEAWWWFLELPESSEGDEPNDVVFDILTLVTLTGTTSFLITFLNLFATGGLSVFESFGLMGQGGLLIAAIGSLKGQGKEMIQNFLEKKGVPRRFHSEVTFGVSSLLFLISLSIYGSLPKLGNIYFEEGKQAYEKGLLIQAQTKYQQALNLAPEHPEINVALGEVYESTGDLEEAKEQYEKAIRKGSVEALNNLGRIAIYENELVTAEAFLQIGLQQVKNLSIPNPDLEYQLNKNLGWAFLQQEKYTEAEQKLKAAIQLDKQITQQQIGGGMAYCLLGKAFTVQNNQQAAQQQFQLCQKYARPETVDEYKWLIENGQENLAEQVDTTSIMSEKQP
ncbi:tetratricopeptide repeat protein [Capilliphycus salinus ALCB114379]|uniref:tetratricopeptide repeat protein n=1 Tax=Capilliphycus salinus TaxID=2768948 RepID=UPI0039A55F2A